LDPPHAPVNSAVMTLTVGHLDRTIPLTVQDNTRSVACWPVVLPGKIVVGDSLQWLNRVPRNLLAKAPKFNPPKASLRLPPNRPNRKRRVGSPAGHLVRRPE